MSCICQYFGPLKNRKNITANNMDNCTEATSKETISIQIIDDKMNTPNMEVSASELAASKAEIWLLKKGLSEANISIENLENLFKTVVSKQHELLGELYELKEQNSELKDECRMQRDYQTMERNVMLRELYALKALLYSRTKLLEETVAKNSELTSSLQDANEKIYMMGMKFLKLKSSQSRKSSAHSAHSYRSTNCT